MAFPTIKPTFAVIGTGAIGGFYGGLLQHAGYEVHFLAEMLEYLNDGGSVLSDNSFGAAQAGGNGYVISTIADPTSLF